LLALEEQATDRIRKRNASTEQTEQINQKLK
jgi:hypothetical protein